MKGILLCGGNGTRLRPLTFLQNKHLLPVYDRPMVLYPLSTLISLGIKDILIISGGENIGSFTEFLGDGSKYSVNLTYKVQKEAGGIAEALGLAKDFAGGDSVTVILGDNIFENSGIPNFEVEENKAYIFTKKVENPQRFGVISLVEEDRIGKPTIIEKPTKPVGDQAVVGLYIYPNDVFDVIPTLKKSERGELEVTDINNHFLYQDRCYVKRINDFWSDAGTFDSLLASSIWAKKTLDKLKNKIIL